MKDSLLQYLNFNIYIRVDLRRLFGMNHFMENTVY